MTSSKPYLIRAIHEWCVDSGLTPYLVVRVDAHTQVPREFVRDGQIVLNISPEATHHLMMGNDTISFQTRFSGVPFQVSVPVAAVAAIYARENGQGMAFEVQLEEDGQVMTEKTGTAEPSSQQAGEDVRCGAEPEVKRVSHLTRIK